MGCQKASANAASTSSQIGSLEGVFVEFMCSPLGDWSLRRVDSWVSCI